MQIIHYYEDDVFGINKILKTYFRQKKTLIMTIFGGLSFMLPPNDSIY